MTKQLLEVVADVHPTDHGWWGCHDADDGEQREVIEFQIAQVQGVFPFKFGSTQRSDSSQTHSGFISS